MIARVPLLIRVEAPSRRRRRHGDQVHDLAPAPGSKQAAQARRTRHRRQAAARRPAAARRARRPAARSGPASKAARRRCTAACRSCAASPTRSGSSTKPSTSTAIQKAIDAGITDINPDSLREAGLAPKRGLVKVLGEGQLTGKATVRAHGFSASAEAAITAAGGTVDGSPFPSAVRPAGEGQRAHQPVTCDLVARCPVTR